MKNSIQRRRALLQLLQAGKLITQREAGEKLKVDPRTIRRDIDYLREIERQPIDGTPEGYRLRAPSLAESRATDDRMFGMLFLAGGFIDSRYATLDSEIAQRWKRCLLSQPETHPEDLGHLGDTVRLSHPVTSEDMLGKIGIIGRSILAKTALIFDYRNLQSEEQISRNAHPLQLREHDGAWYLLAMCHYSMDRRIYALSRIADLAPSLEAVPSPGDEQIKKWLNDDGLSIWLPGSDAEIQTVKVRLSGYALIYYPENPIHPSQVISEVSEESCLLTLRVRDLTGVMLLLRRFTPDIEVLEPESLRNQMIEDLNEARARYRTQK